ncbi:LAMI_0E06370g1_1 [Lachancea mirantina]|uniref:LAMI_0E06370g1_1 n=1 Tax=Lachancea mirantina TaxID=1230905 RepID=A0A1G4JLS1_9SACH|nr:LAMI_0E06370g1_1 [Lachancea mirantina]
MSHVPAWKRIAFKNVQHDELRDETPLNVTTHLATASLSRREKRQMLRGDGTAKKKVGKKDSKGQKREKLERQARVAHRNTVLRDQLRYLIEFYREKVGGLPESVWEHEPAKSHREELESGAATAAGELEVVSTWKFSKQKQNWLLKHVFECDLIPSCYDELLASYFRDLKGTARAALEEQCKSTIEGKSGKPAEATEPAEPAENPGDAAPPQAARAKTLLDALLS